jgi:outer membrane protein assembly factor BamB
MTKFSRYFLFSVCLPLLSYGQAGRGGWTTFGGDLQRSGWNQSETDLTKDNVKNLKLEWSLKLDSQPKGLFGLTAPIVRVNVATPRGVKDLIVVAGASDKLFVVDGDTGKIYWEKTLSTDAKPARPESWLCPNALLATPVIGTLPGKGQAVFSLASDGKLHAFQLVSGEDLIPAMAFVPAFSKAWSMSLANNIIYTATSQGSCTGSKAGVYAMNLADPDRKVTYFQAAVSGAGIWGRAGVAMTADGKVVVETGDGPWDPQKGNYSDSVVILSPKDLKPLDYFTPANRAWMTKKDLDMGSIGPVVFPFHGTELTADSGKEGVIFLLDTKSPGGPDHRTPLFRSPIYTNEEINFAGKGFWGAFSTWEDQAGTRWLYAPAYGPPAKDVKFPTEYGATPNGSVMAFKVELKNDKPRLTPVWNSVDMSVPTPVVIANDVVYALSDGDSPAQFGSNGSLLNTEQRKAAAGHSILYALDPGTGKVLFSSGDTIHSFSHFNAPVVAGGRAYVVTYDGTLYAFSLGSQRLPATQ